jgi:hypothetical protein
LKLLELSGQGLLILVRVLIHFDTDMFAARRMKGRPGRDYLRSPIYQLTSPATEKNSGNLPFVGSSIV